MASKTPGVPSALGGQSQFGVATAIVIKARIIRELRLYILTVWQIENAPLWTIIVVDATSL